LDHIAYFRDLTPADLRGRKAAIIACRSDNDLLQAHASLFQAYLEEGGFLIVMGGLRADLIDPRIAYRETPSNFQWFMQAKPDSGHRRRTPGHSLHRFLAVENMQWHRHGYYLAPAGADRLVELCRPHSEERVGDILFDDRGGFKGRLMPTTLDPHMHHGGHYIPATTRFLNGFYPWVRAEIGAALFPLPRFEAGTVQEDVQHATL